MVTKSKKAMKAAPAVKKAVSPTKPDPPVATATPKGLFTPIPIPDPPEKDENYDQAVAENLAEARTTTPVSTKEETAWGGTGWTRAGEAVAGHSAESANPATSKIKLEELDEVILKQRSSKWKMRHMKRQKYLAEHTAALELENTRLEGELRFCITNTQDLLKKKDLIA
ncbi:hypothetical protein HDU77_010611 [Chytriomyces hyalinus]|nr:hypothetical protein HDU77_010611 [Chytriomyces hyalinus]